MSIFIETKRLFLREITSNDFNGLSEILQNLAVMLPWDSTFSDEELHTWVNENISQYRKYRTGYLAVIRKSDLNFIGIIGIIKVQIENSSFYELGYVLKQNYRGNGYATEGAKACVKYVFSNLNAKKSFLPL
ncbi:MAG: GNAT family N-acetyltransferase [Oscillospiraceae bacterium]|jgi:RimJ/RimL family protein N-acetyltransferase|nr:GNAT family N-acetyltransferase [Oscillospiraceae bacterium]